MAQGLLVESDLRLAVKFFFAETEGLLCQLRRTVNGTDFRNSSFRSGYFLVYNYVRVLTLRRLKSYIYIYDISSLKVNNLTLILLTWRKW